MLTVDSYLRYRLGAYQGVPRASWFDRARAMIAVWMPIKARDIARDPRQILVRLAYFLEFFSKRARYWDRIPYCFVGSRGIEIISLAYSVSEANFTLASEDFLLDVSRETNGIVNLLRIVALIRYRLRHSLSWQDHGCDRLLMWMFLHITTRDLRFVDTVYEEPFPRPAGKGDLALLLLFQEHAHPGRDK